VQRRRDTTDRRRCWVSLTKAGRAEVDAKESHWRSWLGDALDGISDRDLAVTSQVLERLASRFDTYETYDK